MGKIIFLANNDVIGTIKIYRSKSRFSHYILWVVKLYQCNLLIKGN